MAASAPTLQAPLTHHLLTCRRPPPLTLQAGAGMGLDPQALSRDYMDPFPQRSSLTFRISW